MILYADDILLTVAFCCIPRTTYTPPRKRTCLVRYGHQFQKVMLFTRWPSVW